MAWYAKGLAWITVVLLTISTSATRIQDDSDIRSSLWDVDELAKLGKSVGGIAELLFEHDGDNDLSDVLDLPPRKQVEDSLTHAENHAAMTQAAAMETQQNISKDMEKAVLAGQMIDHSVLLDLNKAILRDKTANELVDMTGEYKGTVDEFFDAIERCGVIRGQRDAELERLQAEQEEEAARLQLEKDKRDSEHAKTAAEKAAAEARLKQAEAKLDQALKDQKKAMDDLRHSQNRAEILEAKNLVDLFHRIQVHDSSIKEKDATINANVHPTIHTATSSVRKWANDEMRPLCQKYQKVKIVTKVNPNASCGQALQILIPHVENLEAKKDWESAIDPKSGKTYYFNRATGASSWTWPPS